jgi:hypothetical protein
VHGFYLVHNPRGVITVILMQANPTKQTTTTLIGEMHRPEGAVHDTMATRMAWASPIKIVGMACTVSFRQTLFYK